MILSRPMSYEAVSRYGIGVSERELCERLATGSGYCARRAHPKKKTFDTGIMAHP